MARRSVLIACFLLVGCSGSLKHSWNNFAAYYNTFYNTKKDFKAGLEQVKAQPVQIDPTRPVRPHPAPPVVSGENFARAIENGAELLRHFPESKWVDDALLLMGKAHYYRHEYLSALQKFEALLSLANYTVLRQRAILWKGRVLLDVGSHREAIDYLEEQLADPQIKWKSSNKAEAQILLAEHYSMLGNWQKTDRLLHQAIFYAADRGLQARSYFLRGQALQHQGQFSRAFEMFSKATSNARAYTYLYWSRLKMAEMTYLAGNTRHAIEIYTSMIRTNNDPKQGNGIYFRLAQLYEQEGDTEEAEKYYQQILRNALTQQAGGFRVDTYFRLGQLYSRYYQDYATAAAYFDSSSALVNAQADNQQTNRADVYGQYALLKSKISQVNRLLWLGSLPVAQRDSILAASRQRKQRISGQDKMLNRGGGNTGLKTIGFDEEGAFATSFGFLNHRNRQKKAQARQQFKSIWGNRPLADNWRRVEEVGGSVSAGIQQSEMINDPSAAAQTEPQSELNLAAIPDTPEATRVLKEERSYLQYRLGNLFFLNLNQPDSAAFYYKRVAHDSRPELAAQALYSLYILYDLRQLPDSAVFYKKRVVREYPDSEYAARISKDANASPLNAQKINSNMLLRKKVQLLMNNHTVSFSDSLRAEKLRTLALENQASVLAPAIFYQAIRAAIQAAKVDSSKTMSVIAAQRETNCNFSGASWKRVHRLLDEYQQFFPETAHKKQVEGWAQFLEEAQAKCRDSHSTL